MECISAEVTSIAALGSRPAIITKRLQSRITRQRHERYGAAISLAHNRPAPEGGSKGDTGVTAYPGFNRPSQTERKADIQRSMQMDKSKPVKRQ